jgi:hypothetical protein
VPAQASSSALFAKLARAQPDLVPASTVLLMAEHALDRLAAAPAEAAFSDALQNSTAALACDGVWQQLDQEKAMSLGLRALEQSGALVLTTPESSSASYIHNKLAGLAMPSAWC